MPTEINWFACIYSSDRFSTAIMQAFAARSFFWIGGWSIANMLIESIAKYVSRLTRESNLVTAFTHKLEQQRRESEELLRNYVRSLIPRHARDAIPKCKVLTRSARVRGCTLRIIFVGYFACFRAHNANDYFPIPIQIRAFDFSRAADLRRPHCRYYRVFMTILHVDILYVVRALVVGANAITGLEP